MSALSVLYPLWFLFVLLFVALMIYRSTITRYEEDKLFLDDYDDYHEHIRYQIVRRVNQLQPYVYSIGTVASAMSLTIVGIYVYQAIQILQS